MSRKARIDAKTSATLSVEETEDFIGNIMGPALQAINGQLPKEVGKNFYTNETDQDRVAYLLEQDAVHQVKKNI